MDMGVKAENLIFVVGFTRGGTTWLRNIIGAHPVIGEIQKELIPFCDCNTKSCIFDKIKSELPETEYEYYVHKSPLDVMHLEKWVRFVPESKVIVIIRDPKDSLTSHQRGTLEWMKGSTINKIYRKLYIYYECYKKYANFDNITLVRYEDLHNRFEDTVRSLFDFIGVSSHYSIIKKAHSETKFITQTGRTPGNELRSSARRKGIVGDWKNHLSEKDQEEIKKNWSHFTRDLGYE
jgi:hypothetical protein